MNDQKISPKKKLEGRVAQILNERELAINIGSNHGAQLGMKFAILSESPLEVKDPQTKETLDIIDREKVRVVVSEIRPKISICKTYRVRKFGGGLSANFSLMKSLLEPAREVKETLKAEDASLPQPLSPEESYVKINDRVVLIEEE